MVGVPVLSLVPCFIQLLKIPITHHTVSIGIGISMAVSAVILAIRFRKPKFSVTMPQLYEIPFFIVIAVLMGVSIWRCYYYPVTPRDMLSGPELLAEFTVREKTMINSVYNIDLQTTNNYFKSPYITCLQIMYKLLVQPFGQIWLSVLFISFTGWFYIQLRERIHPVFAGILLLCFFIIPDMFAYTFMILYDYSNMVFFCVGFFFISRFIHHNKMNDLAFAAFMLGLSTYIRTETLVLVGLATPLITWHLWKKQQLALPKVAMHSAVFLLTSAFFYLLCTNVFIASFVPVHFDVSSQMNKNLANVGQYFHRFTDMNELLLFSQGGQNIYGMFNYIFVFVLILDLVWPRKYNLEARVALYGIAVVYFGLPLLNYLFPLVDLFNTTKRGFFKAMPLMVLYMANSGFLQKISTLIKNWEYPEFKEQKMEPVARKPMPRAPLKK
jgi:hypothetical protein